MRYEYKIKIDMDLYGEVRPNEDPGFANGVVRSLRDDLKAGVNDALEHYKYSHRFGGVKIAVIPHDNDRDYTEEDAEKHLNGEPEKKRKTYAEDFFEKFPNAVGAEGIPGVAFQSVYGMDVFLKLLGCADFAEYRAKYGHLDKIREVEDELDIFLVEYGEMPEEKVWKMPMLDESEDADA